MLFATTSPSPSIALNGGTIVLSSRTVNVIPLLLYRSILAILIPLFPYISIIDFLLFFVLAFTSSSPNKSSNINSNANYKSLSNEVILEQLPNLSIYEFYQEAFDIYKEVQFADDKKYKIVVKNETEVKSYNAKVLISDKTNDLAFVSIIDRDFKGVDFIPYSLYFTLHPRQLPVQARRAMGTRKSCASASANKWSVTEFACTARRRQDWQ